MLISQEVRDYRRELDRFAKLVSAQLRSYADRTGRVRADIEDLVALWRADQICDRTNHKLIAVVHGWEAGKEPLAAGTISTKLRMMRAVVDKALADRA